MSLLMTPDKKKLVFAGKGVFVWLSTSLSFMRKTSLQRMTFVVYFSRDAVKYSSRKKKNEFA
jgi:hypothetical protein